MNKNLFPIVLLLIVGQSWGQTPKIAASQKTVCWGSGQQAKLYVDWNGIQIKATNSLQIMKHTCTWSTRDVKDTIKVIPSTMDQKTMYSVDITLNTSNITKNSLGSWDTITNVQKWHDTLSIKLVNSPHPPMVDGRKEIICRGDTINFSVREPEPSYTYKWNKINGTHIQATPQHDTIFTVVAKDESGCIGTNFVKVKVNHLPIPSITESMVSGKLIITAHGGSWYQWSNRFTCPTVTPEKTDNSLTLTAFSPEGCKSTITWTRK